MSPGKWKCNCSVLVRVRSSLPIQDSNGVRLDTSFPSTSYVNSQCHATQPIIRKRADKETSKKHFKSTWQFIIRNTYDPYADHKDPIMYYHIQIHINFSSSFGSAFHITNIRADNSTVDQIPRLLWNLGHSYSQKLTLVTVLSQEN
jgi:hypothetical protein